MSVTEKQFCDCKLKNHSEVTVTLLLVIDISKKWNMIIVTEDVSEMNEKESVCQDLAR